MTNTFTTGNKATFLINKLISKNLDIYFFIFLFAIIFDNKNIQVTLSIIGAVGGLFLLIKDWHLYSRELINNKYLYVSLAFLIPIAISMIDTLYPEKRFFVFNTMLLYVLMGSIPIYMCHKNINWKRLEGLTVIAIVFIAIDSIIQWLTHYHILGFNPPIGVRVYGIFGNEAHLSYFLATFLPVIFFYLFTSLEKKTTTLKILITTLILFTIVISIMLGGARAGIITMIISLLLFIYYLLYTNKIKNRFRFISITLTVLIVFIIIGALIPEVQQRFTNSISSFGSENFLYHFTSARTNIWLVGFQEIQNYPINGVGTRGFNNLYQTYPEDYKIFDYIWHPHLHGLEVLIETGLIGFIPYTMVCIYLLRRMFTAKAGNMWIMVGFLALMPINTHVPLYTNYWFPITWLPIMIGLAQAYRADKKKNF